MKILTILGARPQFIKAGTVSREIKKYKSIDEIIVHTGQHYDANMSDVFFKEMQIPKPTYFLGIGGTTHGAMTGQMIEKIEEVVLKEKPDWIMVYGDTNSTLSGAIVASKLHVKLAHIEAGLRSFNMQMPEEVNRILTDRVSSILFCPTDTAITNLYNEGYKNFNSTIINSGDVMLDGAMFYQKISEKPECEVSDNYILCTIHRAENTDNKERLIEIFDALNELAKTEQIILPLHPRTKKVLHDLDIDTSALTIINPVGYLEMVWLINNCQLVITDSGGLQKEAYFFKKFCITLRDETEWVELVDIGVNILVGANREKILATYKNNSGISIENSVQNIYGLGKASELIVNELLNYKEN